MSEANDLLRRNKDFFNSIGGEGTLAAGAKSKALAKQADIHHEPIWVFGVCRSEMDAYHLLIEKPKGRGSVAQTGRDCARLPVECAGLGHG
nr:hypothetical protein [uncultured Celeribacter sp.]